MGILIGIFAGLILAAIYSHLNDRAKLRDKNFFDMATYCVIPYVSGLPESYLHTVAILRKSLDGCAANSLHFFTLIGDRVQPVNSLAYECVDLSPHHLERISTCLRDYVNFAVEKRHRRILLMDFTESLPIEILRNAAKGHPIAWYHWRPSDDGLSPESDQVHRHDCEAGAARED